MGAQKTIIYRLLFLFHGHLHYIYSWGGEMGVATTLAPYELGPPSPNPTNKLAYWMTSSVNCF